MKKIRLLILPIITIVLEILPYGAVLVFATSPTDRVRETFSYFSLTPFGYANFAPFITAMLTCVVLLLALISIKQKKVCKALFIVSLVATVISQVASCAFVLCVLFGKHIEVPITFGGYDLKVIGRVTSIGMSAFLIILFDNVMLISLNMMLQRYGGDNSDMLLTCNTIVQSFELLITMPLGGLTMGTQTILGYNLGARRPEKILRAQRYIFVIAVSFCVLMTLAAQTIPHLFAGIFTKEPEYIAMTARLIRIYTLGTVLLGMQYEIVDGFTGMGVVKIALPLSVFRKVIFFACIFILPRFLPIEQIFFCEPISDILPPLVSILVYALTIKRVINRGPQKQIA